MKQSLHLILVTTLFSTTIGCSTMTVRADHDSQIDFGAYSSFALFERQGKQNRRPQMSPLVDRRIASSMAGDLKSKGFRSATARDADMLVTFYTAVRERVVINRAGWYGWGRWGWHGGATWVNSFPEGTLVIDIIDRRKRELVWRGVGQGAFSSTNPSDEKVAKRVAKILSSFPPAG